jgi:hypothetical protein
MEQHVIRLVLADDERRIIGLRAVGMMDNRTRRQRLPKCPFSPKHVDTLAPA